MLTYPRTDSRALPEDYIGTVKETLELARRRGKRAEHPYAPFAKKILKNSG